MNASFWRHEAESRWGHNALNILGDGPFALLAWCHALLVYLWPTRAKAEAEKTRIDGILSKERYPLSGSEIIDLTPEAELLIGN